MKINQVLSVVPVRDVQAAGDWYATLLGRPADARPMDSLAQWTITDTSTLQIFHDPANAGGTTVNFEIDSVDDANTTLRGRGIVPGELVEASQFVRILPVTDPDGNTVTLLESR